MLKGHEKHHQICHNVKPIPKQIITKGTNKKKKQKFSTCDDKQISRNRKFSTSNEKEPVANKQI